jgi:tRNA-dihydrouridine synthase A
MLQPQLVGEAVAAMKQAVGLPVTVKCRIGVDDQDPEAALDGLADAAIDAGADAIWVHARKAWLTGLSPKENRDVPPLDYDWVYRLKQRFPETFIGINGGIASLDQAEAHLAHVDGVMLGRAAYHAPALLAEVDARFYADPGEQRDLFDIAEAMLPYIDAEVRKGTRLASITRHMLGLFHGMPGARQWRRTLTVDGSRHGAGVDVLRDALAEVRLSTPPSDLTEQPSEMRRPALAPA